MWTVDLCSSTLTRTKRAYLAAVATLDLILFDAFPDAYYFDCTSFVVAKVYSNACVAMLNNRMRIIGGRDRSFVPTDISLTFPSDLESRHAHDGRSNSRHIQVEGISLQDLDTDVNGAGHVEASSNTPHIFRRPYLP